MYTCGGFILIFGKTNSYVKFKNKIKKKKEYTCMLSRFSHVQLFVTPWTVAYQVPLSMAFSR